MLVSVFRPTYLVVIRCSKRAKKITFFVFNVFRMFLRMMLCRFFFFLTQPTFVQFLEIDRPFNLENFFLKRSQNINEPHQELHNISVMTAYTRKI